MLFVGVILLNALPLKALRLSEAKLDSYNGTAKNLVRTSFNNGWSKTAVLTVPPPQKTQFQTDITLCIPLDGSVTNHVTAFEDVFLPSLQAQSFLPLEVIVVATGINKSSAQKLKRVCALFSSTVRIRAGLQAATAATNRNRCAKSAHGSIISFFDADDEMHSRRLELLWHVFQKHHPRGVLHGFSFVSLEGTLSEEFEVLDGLNFSDQNALQDLFDNEHKYAVSMGWITVNAEVFQHVKQNESKPTGEDNQFIMNIIDHYGVHDSTLVYVGLPLGRYSNGWKRQWEGGTKWRKPAF